MGIVALKAPDFLVFFFPELFFFPSLWGRGGLSYLSAKFPPRTHNLSLAEPPSAQSLAGGRID